MTTVLTAEREAIEKIDLTAIDPNSFADVESSPEALRFAVKLNTAPSEVWTTVFHTLYGRVGSSVHPPIEVVGDRLVIDYLPRYDAELPAFFRMLRGVADMTNEEMVKTAEIAAGMSVDERKAKFRETLLNLKW